MNAGLSRVEETETSSVPCRLDTGDTGNPAGSMSDFRE